MDAVKSLVRDRLEKALRNEVQGIMNKAVQDTLDMVSESLIVKFVAQSNDTFKIEFTWAEINEVQR